MSRSRLHLDPPSPTLFEPRSPDEGQYAFVEYDGGLWGRPAAILGLFMAFVCVLFVTVLFIAEPGSSQESNANNAIIQAESVLSLAGQTIVSSPSKNASSATEVRSLIKAQTPILEPVNIAKKSEGIRKPGLWLIDNGKTTTAMYCSTTGILLVYGKVYNGICPRSKTAP